MTDVVEELADRGRSLPPAERVRLLDLLLESLHPIPATEAQDPLSQEIASRVERFERGESELHDAQEVMAEAARIAP